MTNTNTTSKTNTIWWIVIIALVIGVVVGVIWLAERNNASTDGTTVGDAAIVTADDWATIDHDTDVTLIEYGDFQCPFCGSFHGMVRSALRDLPDVRFVYRHYPLTSIHNNARLAAQAAEAAGQQEKFWEMYDQLYDGQDAWSDLSSSAAKAKFIEYAGDLGLDTTQFEADLESSAVEQAVSDDVASARSINAPGTPTLILNGVKISNPRSAAELKQTLQDAAK